MTVRFSSPSRAALGIGSAGAAVTDVVRPGMAAAERRVAGERDLRHGREDPQQVVRRRVARPRLSTA